MKTGELSARVSELNTLAVHLPSESVLDRLVVLVGDYLPDCEVRHLSAAVGSDVSEKDAPAVPLAPPAPAEVTARGKRCERCGRVKAHALFKRHGKSSDGYRKHCIACEDGEPVSETPDEPAPEAVPYPEPEVKLKEEPDYSGHRRTALPQTERYEEGRVCANGEKCCAPVDGSPAPLSAYNPNDRCFECCKRGVGLDG